jgi:hypothetical protein
MYVISSLLISVVEIYQTSVSKWYHQTLTDSIVMEIVWVVNHINEKELSKFLFLQ